MMTLPSAAMELYIIRHAEPAYPADALTPQGHRDAQQLAEWLGRLAPSAVFSSSMQRAIETAQYTAKHVELPLQIEPWMQELESWVITQTPQDEFPAWGVSPPLIRSQDVLRRNWHTFPPFHARLQTHFQDLQKHSDAFLSRHGYVRCGSRYRAASAQPHRLAIFCHYGFGLSWLAHLLEIPLPLMWASFHLKPSSVTTVVFENDREQWAYPRCTSLGSLAHLPQPPDKTA